MTISRDTGALLLALMLLAAALCGEGAACAHSCCLPGHASELRRRLSAATASFVTAARAACGGALSPRAFAADGGTPFGLALAAAPAGPPLRI